MCNHHIKHVFTDCLDVTAQFQFLAIQQHHANLPLHVLHLPTLLADRHQNEKSCEFIKDGSGSLSWFQTSPLLRRELSGVRRAHWPSSQILVHGSSVIRMKSTMLDIFILNLYYNKVSYFGSFFVCFGSTHNSTDIAAHTSLLTFCCNQVSPEKQDSFLQT